MIFVRRFPAHSWSPRRVCHPSAQLHPFWYTPSHPDFGQIPAADNKDNADSGSSKPSSSALIYRGRNIRIYENESNFTISIDLPGVKGDDITAQVLDQGILQIEAERKVGNKVTSKFSKQFPLDENSVDTDGIHASYNDGVLRVEIPKKTEQPVKPEPTNVSIEASYAPTDKKTALSADLPGIKLEDVKVLYHEGDISVKGERRHGGVTVKKVNFSVQVNTKKIDTTQLVGFLADGVLTVVGPEREPDAPKRIAINGDRAAVQKKEDFQVAQQQVPEKEIEVVAETVTEEEATADEAESASWENVGDEKDVLSISKSN